MFLEGRGCYFQAQKDEGVAVAADQFVQTAGADKPKKPILPETDIRQIKELAVERGEAAAAAQAIGLMNS